MTSLKYSAVADGLVIVETSPSFADGWFQLEKEHYSVTDRTPTSEELERTLGNPYIGFIRKIREPGTKTSAFFKFICPGSTAKVTDVRLTDAHVHAFRDFIEALYPEFEATQLTNNTRIGGPEVITLAPKFPKELNELRYTG